LKWQQRLVVEDGVVESRGEKAESGAYFFLSLVNLTSNDIVECANPPTTINPFAL